MQSDSFLAPPHAPVLPPSIQVGHLIPTRHDQPELLDQGSGSMEDVAANLGEMARSNRWLGGLRALTRHLYPRLEACREPVVLADLGCGSAETPADVVRWARGRGLPLRVWAVDWAERNLRVARDRTADLPEIRLLRADAGRLPFPPGSVDYVVSSLFLHHFSPEGVIDLLRGAFGCARRGLIMTDLTRGWLPLLAFHLIWPVFARNYLTRHDGALSIRRAYTPAELAALARAAGLPEARVYTHFPWRVTLVVDK